MSNLLCWEKSKGHEGKIKNICAEANLLKRTIRFVTCRAVVRKRRQQALPQNPFRVENEQSLCGTFFWFALYGHSQMKQDLGFSGCCWRFKQSGILARCFNNRCSSANVLQELAAGNVRVKEGRSCIMLHVTSGPKETGDTVGPSHNRVPFRDPQQRCKRLL